MKIFALILVLLTTATSFADFKPVDSEFQATDVEFTIKDSPPVCEWVPDHGWTKMVKATKYDPNYKGFHILWLGYEDPQLYSELVAKYPDAKHSYVKSISNAANGIYIQSEGVVTSFEGEGISGILASNLDRSRLVSRGTSDGSDLSILQVPLSTDNSGCRSGSCQNQSGRRFSYR